MKFQTFMKTKIAIAVTEDDIKNGERKNMGFCPIALAVKRAFSVDHVRVFNDYVQVQTVQYDLPLSAQGFVERFDLLGHSSVVPFVLELGEC